MSSDALKDKLSDFLSVSPDVFWETDTTGLLTFISMQITALVDKTPEQLTGQPIVQIFEGMLCYEDWQKWMSACLKGKIQPLSPIPLQLQDGRMLYVSAYAQRFAKGLRGYLRDVTEAVESMLNATEVEQQLADTIQAIPYGVALFDREDKLVFINNKNRDIFEDLTPLMVTGTPFEDFVRGMFETGLQPVPQEEMQRYLDKRMRLHRNGYGRREVKLRDDIWVEISEHLTPEGNVVVSWSDLTSQKRREQALASLLSDESDTLDVPQRAAKAIALAMGCRIGGVVHLAEDGVTANVVALWDGDHFVPTFSYACEGAPCKQVYEQGGYVHLTENLNTAFIPEEYISKARIDFYQGLALRNQEGEVIGHIFAIDDRAEFNYHAHGREVFHLIGHWVEMEFRRQELHLTITDAQKRFRDFAEVASDWFWEMNEEFEFTFSSEHAPEAAQLKLAEMIKAAHEQQTTDWSQSALAQSSNKIVARRAFRDVQINIKEGNDQELMYLVGARPVFDETGDFMGYRGTGNDVSEVMAANQRAARLEAWLWEALESSPEAFVLYDKNDRLLISNQKFKDIFFPQAQEKIEPGVKFEEVLEIFFTQNNVSNVPPEKVAQWKTNRIRHRGHSEAGPYNETMANGRIYMAVEHRTREGGIASFYVDITKMHEQEQSLMRAKEEAESASRSKSEFLANISHELRTPLNAIIGFSELIRDELAGPPNSPKYKEYIGDIHNSGMHLMELINDILDLSKAEAGMIEGSERITDIVEVIEASLKLMGPKAERAYVNLTANFSDQLPYLYIDPKHLRQILLNLVSNSVKFTPEGGEVEITADYTEYGLSISVRDTGIGMRPEDVPKAMSAFGQIDSSLARKYNGTGLGLPLTNRLVQHYEGVLDIKTAPNEGTTVSMSFPEERLRYPDDFQIHKKVAE